MPNFTKFLVILRVYGYFSSSPMKYTPYYKQPRPAGRSLSAVFAGILHFLRLTFVEGPNQLFNSRIEPKTAAIMSGMCAPALLFWAILTLPAMIFRSPEYHAYYHFAAMIEQDPVRWVVLVLATSCLVLSMAVPAAMRKQAGTGSRSVENPMA